MNVALEPIRVMLVTVITKMEDQSAGRRREIPTYSSLARLASERSVPTGEAKEPLLLRQVSNGSETEDASNEKEKWSLDG